MAEFTMISTHHNYDNGYIALVNLNLGKLPQMLHVNDYDLTLKSEFHISLISAKKIALLINPTRAEEIQEEIVTAFLDFIKTTPLTDYMITNTYRLVKRDDRVTLVVLVDMPGHKDFFTELEKKYDMKLPVQVTHITLYTLQPETGIGILSQDELEQNSEPATVPLTLQ